MANVDVNSVVNKTITAFTKEMVSRYLDFAGKTNRADYWYAFLGNFVIALALGIIVGILPFLSIVSTLYGLAVLIPGLAMTVRRFRDLNKSPWFVLLALIPLVGWIIVIYYMVQPTPAE